MFDLWLGSISQEGKGCSFVRDGVENSEKMGYMRRDIMWLRISLCDVLHSASRVHVVYSCVFVYEYSLMLES